MALVNPIYSLCSIKIKQNRNTTCVLHNCTVRIFYKNCFFLSVGLKTTQCWVFNPTVGLFLPNHNPSSWVKITQHQVIFNPAVCPVQYLPSASMGQKTECCIFSVARVVPLSLELIFVPLKLYKNNEVLKLFGYILSTVMYRVSVAHPNNPTKINRKNGLVIKPHIE